MKLQRKKQTKNPTKKNETKKESSQLQIKICPVIYFMAYDLHRLTLHTVSSITCRTIVSFCSYINICLHIQNLERNPVKNSAITVYFLN